MLLRSPARSTTPSGLRFRVAAEVLRHVGEFPFADIPHSDDLEALADAVREAARTESAMPVADAVEGSTGRRGHLRVVPAVP